MIFEYQMQRTFTKAIDVVDIGNMCLRCSTEDGTEYYILTKTIFGKVHLLKLGPVTPDLNILLDNFSVLYKKFDYKEATIEKEVSQVINDGRKKNSRSG